MRCKLMGCLSGLYAKAKQAGPVCAAGGITKVKRAGTRDPAHKYPSPEAYISYCATGYATQVATTLAGGVAAAGVKIRNTPSLTAQKFRIPVILKESGADPVTKAVLTVPPPPAEPTATKL